MSGLVVEAIQQSQKTCTHIAPDFTAICFKITNSTNMRNRLGLRRLVFQKKAKKIDIKSYIEIINAQCM